MTNKQKYAILKKVEELLEQHNVYVLRTALRKLSTGGVDPHTYNLSNYALPKVLLTSALHDHKNDFTPLSGKQQEDVRNLSFF